MTFVLRCAPTNCSRIDTKYKATLAQVALAWLLRQGYGIILIPGSKQLKYVEKNFAALDIGLSADDLKTLMQLADQVYV
jgi:diketogulonate reductase-like aldo/keto reductase